MKREEHVVRPTEGGTTGQPTLKRSLGLPQGTAMTVGAVLGAGILVLPALTAELAGPGSVFSWLMICLLALPLTFTLGRLATRQPDAGGVVSYARRAFGDHYALMLGWVLLGSIPVGAPVAALVGANYLGRLVGLSHGHVAAVAAVMMALVVFLNVRGIEISARVQVMVVAGIIVLLLAAVGGAAHAVRADSFTPLLPGGWAAVLSAAGIIFYSFAGWEMMVPLAEEFRDPRRDLPLSLFIAALIILALYLSVVVVTVGTGSYGAGASVAPLSLLVRRGFGAGAETLTGLCALFITFGTAHANTAGYSRILYAQSRDGDFPCPSVWRESTANIALQLPRFWRSRSSSPESLSTTGSPHLRCRHW
jgi:amino acid efflux transporter